MFRRVGGAPVAMPPSETYTALDKGVVDAADDTTIILVLEPSVWPLKPMWPMSRSMDG